MKPVDLLRLAALAVTAILPAQAWAYVDPGSASMALQMLVGGLVAALFVLKSYFQSAKAYVFGLFGKKAAAETSAATDSEPAADGAPRTDE